MVATPPTKVYVVQAALHLGCGGAIQGVDTTHTAERNLSFLGWVRGGDGGQVGLLLWLWGQQG